ncbi:MAG: fused MFS/spermidine synthase [Calditrichia bacterium]
MKPAIFKSAVIFPALGLGVLALTAQVIFIRLLLQYSMGNELAIGMALAVWLFGTAFGSTYFSRFLKALKIFDRLPGLIFPVIILNELIVEFVPKIFDLSPGVYPLFHTWLAILALTILPASVFCGALFPYMVEVALKMKAATLTQKITRIYIWESIGSFLAALALNFIFLHIMNGLQILAATLFIFYLCIILYQPKTGRKQSAGVYLGLCIILLWAGPWTTREIHQFIYRPYAVVTETDTPYGNVCLLRLEQQTSVLFQRRIEYTLPDPFSAETRGLLPLLCHPGPENILFIGGNLLDILPYLKKSSTIKNIVYLEIDPVLLRFQRDSVQNAAIGSRMAIDFVAADPREYLTRTHRKFDLICLNQPEPSTLSLNRLYSREFYRLVRERLNREGIFFFTIRSSENFINRELGEYINVLQNTLRSEFPNVFIIPGDENHFLASGSVNSGNLLAALPERLQQQAAEAAYLTPIYLKYRLSENRMQFLGEQLSRWNTPDTNSDFNLKGYLHHFLLWSVLSGSWVQNVFHFLSSFRMWFFFAIYFSFILLHIFMKRRERRNYLWKMSIIGGLSIALEIVILLEHQILFGTIYFVIAIIFGIFMLGLAVGAAIRGRQAGVRHERAIITGLLLCTGFLGLPIIFEWSMISQMILFDALRWLFFPSVVFAVGFLSGIYFRHITHTFYSADAKGQSGLTYGSDLAGAMGGAFLISILFIPLFGIPATLLFIGLLLLMMFF